MVSRKKEGEHASSSSGSRQRLQDISEIEAATRIQAHYRGNRARRRMHRISHSEQQSTHRSERERPSSSSERRTNSKPKEDAPDAPCIGSAPEDVPQEKKEDKKEKLTKDKRMESNVTDYSLMRYELNQKSSRIPRPIQRARVALYLLFEEPRSSCVAQVLSVFLLGCIIVSIVVFMLETMPELQHVDKDAWLAIEVACTAVFTVEYVVRLLVCTAGPPGTTICQFIRTPMNMCDLGAILPFYVSLIMSSLKIAKALGILRTVRLIRLFRIFKLGRYSSGLQLMASALKNSSQALWVLGFFLFIGIVLFSSAIYYVEKMSCPERETLVSRHLNDGSSLTELDVYVAECRSSTNGMSASHGLCCDEYESPLDFPSIVAAFWWATVTMTTVGFGEVYPRTDVGRLVATATMLSGILLIALPVAIIGRKFQEAYDEHQAALQGFCESSRSTSFADRLSTSNSSSRIRKSNSDHTSSSSGPVRQVTQKSMGQRKHAGESASNAPEGPSLSEMGRRLRLMKLPDGEMTIQAHDLAELLEEASDVQKEINSMQSFEANRQTAVVEQFDNLLKRLCELETGSALAKLARFSPLSCKAPAGGMKVSVQAMSDIGKEIASPKLGSSLHTHSVVRQVVEDAEHPCAVSRLDAEEALAPGTTPPPYRPPPPMDAFQAQDVDSSSPRALSSREISSRTNRSDESSIGQVPTVHVPDTRCDTLR